MLCQIYLIFLITFFLILQSRINILFLSQHKPEDAISMKQCEFCNKSFMTTSELKNHLLYHMKERKHNCTLCSSKFLEKRHLDRHLRRCHSGGIKNFICNVCGKGFYERYELNYHWKTSLACSNHSSLLTCGENTNDITFTKLDSNAYAQSRFINQRQKIYSIKSNNF